MGNLQDDIIKYKKGELSPKEMHALEKRALTDPFLAEALEGIENIPYENLALDVTQLNQKILNQKKAILFTPLRIAAGVILIATAVVVFYQLSPKHDAIALKTEKPNAPAVPKSEGPKPEEKIESQKKVEAPKPTNTESRKPKATKGLEGKGKTKPVDQNEVAEVAKPKTEDQPDVVVTQALAAPEKKAEELKVEAKEQAPASVAMEPVQEAVTEEKELKKTARAETKIKSTRYHNDVASGAGVSGETQTKPKSISGKVISAEDGAPLPGVNVIVEGTTQGTVTDASGNFSLQPSGENQRLVFSFIGLQTQEVSIKGKDKVDVELKPDVSQLSEVVVSGFGVKRDDEAEPVIHLASPTGGMKAYNKYLDANVHYPDQALKNNIKGKVKVEFSVRTDGSLDDYKVVKSLGYGCDEEVIRLIKEGPKWSPSTENGQAVESTVLVGVKFDPAKSGR